MKAKALLRLALLGLGFNIFISPAPAKAQISAPSSETTVLDQRFRAQLSGITYLVPLKLPQQQQPPPQTILKAEVFVENGNGQTLTLKDCSEVTNPILKFVCQLKNLQLTAQAILTRPQEVQISVGDVELIRTGLNLTPFDGTVQIERDLNLSANPTLKVYLKGFPTSSIRVRIQTKMPENLPPVALFSIQRGGGVAPETVHFSALASSDPDGVITEYLWDFGDGTQGLGVMSFHTYQAGTFNVTLRVRDNRGATSTATQTITVQANRPPTIELTHLSPLTGTAPLSVWFKAEASDPDGDPVVLSWDFGDGASSIVTDSSPVHEYLNPGRYAVTVTARDSRGLTATETLEVNAQALQLPPDPKTLAPELADDRPVEGLDRYGFLLAGDNPVQVGAQPEALEPERSILISGLVRDGSGQPLSGVKVSVVGAPQLGHTLSRADGRYDLLVNGGAQVILDFKKSGYSYANRSAETLSLASLNLEDVWLVKKDDKVTVVSLAANPGQIHRASVSSDDDGERVPALYLPPGTQAQVVLPNGTRQTLSQASIRITELTQGENGLRRMPANLPERSAYTFAADYTLDEAQSLGAERVEFSQAIPIYLDNYLNFPPGTAIPVGFLNPKTGYWEPMNDGIVAKILNVDESGQAVLDLGTGRAPSAEELSPHGFTETELKTLAQTYSVGESFWRARTSHFSIIDLNMNFPGNESPANPPNSEQDRRLGDQNEECRLSINRCVINPYRRTFQETVELPGTGMALSFSSERAQGRLSDGLFRQQMFSDALINAFNGRVIKAEAEIHVAGRVHRQEFLNPNINDTFEFVWDGFDSFGRQDHGTRAAQVKLKYFYPGAYALPSYDPSRPQTFNTFNPGVVVQTVPSRSEFAVERTFTAYLSSPFNWAKKNSSKQFGNWSLSVHHTYDPVRKILYRGDGSTQDGAVAPSTMSRFATIRRPLSLDRDARGNYYVTSPLESKIYKINPQGEISVFAGNGTPGNNGDGGLAIEAELTYPDNLRVGPDGSVYFTDSRAMVVRKVNPQGIISTIAGTGVRGSTGDYGPAINAQLSSPGGLVIGRDGSIYVSERGVGRIRRISPNGIISPFAGTGVPGFSGDGGPATEAQFDDADQTEIDDAGNFYIVDLNNARVRKISPTGIITTIAGNGNFGSAGDGGPAIEAELGGPWDVAVDPSGQVYIADTGARKIRVISRDGIINTLIGTGEPGFNGDDQAPLEMHLGFPADLFFNPDGSMLVLDLTNDRILKYGKALQGRFSNSTLITSSDGSEVYVFDVIGRHVQTLYANTWKTKYGFRYDTQNDLVEVIDAFGKKVMIDRDSSGRALSIRTHFGQSFELEHDGRDFLVGLTYPTGERHRFDYSDQGLLTQYIKPNGNQIAMSYDEQGYLSKEEDSQGGFIALEKPLGSNRITQTTAEGYQTTYNFFLNNENFDELQVTHPNGGRDLSFTRDIYITHQRYDGRQERATRQTDSRLPGGLSEFRSYRQVVHPQGLGHETLQQKRSYTYFGDISKFERVDEIRANNRTNQTIRYNSQTKVLNSSTGGGRYQETGFNDQEQVVYSSIAGFLPVQYAYDSLGRVIEVRQGDRVTQMNYDASGFLESITDAENRTVRFKNDTIGRVLETEKPDGQIVQFSYDSNSNLTGLRPAEKPRHQMGYTLVDLLMSYTSADGESTFSWFYDLDRRVKSFIRGDGRVVGQFYGQNGSSAGLGLTAMGSSDMSFSFVYNDENKNLKTIFSSDERHIDYNTLGNTVLNKTFNLNNVFISFGYQYRTNGLLPIREFLTTSSGTTQIGFGYDDDDLLIQAGALYINRSSQNGLIQNKGISPLNEAITYSEFGEVSLRRFTNQGGEIYRERYLRDRLGRIVEKQVFDALSSPQRDETFNYRYDLQGRLVEVKRNGAVISLYGYDANSNRVSRNGVSFTVNATDQITASSSGDQYQYNPHGEMIRKSQPSRGVEYEFQHTTSGQLRRVEISNGVRIEYLIDAENRRSARLKNGLITSQFVYDLSGRLSAELDASGALRARFIYGSEAHAPDYMLLASGERLYFIKDHLGSILKVINPVNLNVMQAIEYSEFGEVLLDTNPGFQPFGFAGGHYDHETKLVRFGARDYDPELGRWLSRDPILFNGGLENLYSYVGGDPVNKIDPSGLWAAQVGIGGSFMAFTLGGQGEAGIAFSYSAKCGFQLGGYGGVQGRIGAGIQIGGGPGVTITPDADSVNGLDGVSVGAGFESPIGGAAVSAGLNDKISPAYSIGGPSAIGAVFGLLGYTWTTGPLYSSRDLACGCN